MIEVVDFWWHDQNCVSIAAELCEEFHPRVLLNIYFRIRLLLLTMKMASFTTHRHFVSSWKNIYWKRQARSWGRGHRVQDSPPPKLSNFLEKFVWDIKASMLLQWKRRNYREAIWAVVYGAYYWKSIIRQKGHYAFSWHPLFINFLPSWKKYYQ